ncbi:MAG: hypothetical protein M3160_03240 [Candidatus Eremiobacteraeota bacterium]|nr:hypothetical protein [Candidatus Eremiobacteraeota bacterium]
MSVKVPGLMHFRLRAHGTELVFAAGRLAVITVVAAGATAGFFAWYFIVIPKHSETLSTLALPLALLAGAFAGLWAWSAYSRYFAARTGIRLERSLQYDAGSWAALLLLWLTLALPLSITHGARAVVLAAGAYALIKLLVAVRFNQTVREVAIDFALTRLAIIVIAELAAIIIGQRAGSHVAESSNLLLAVWGRWDAVHYLDIATHGYFGTDMAFFPLYPALIAILGRLMGNHLIAGMIISNAAFFFGLLFFYKLVEHEFDRGVARRAIFYISIFPTAVFFSAVYTEALFFALTVASFYYIREHKWLLAGVIGFFAALTRVEGILLLVPFAIEWWNVYHRGERGSMQPIYGASLIPLGLFAYMAYLWVLRGDPLYFSHVQAHWHRHFAPPWVSVWQAVHLVFTARAPQTIANKALELTFTTLMIGVLVAGYKRLRPSFSVYMALSILVPMSTSSLMSMQRFALVLFPMFAILALWGERPSVNNAIVALALPLLGLYTVLFANWYWVA